MVTEYVIYTRVMDVTRETVLPGTNTTRDFSIDEENVVYEFAVQANNNGGEGPVSNYMAVFFCSTGG